MRTQQIVLEGVSSSSITVTSGVPQGAVLGPLHFILYLNDLPEGISSQVLLLADDCILYREINTLIDCQYLQKDINTLCNWKCKWQMKFNIDKCYIMHVTHKRNPLLMTYKVNGRPLEATAGHTYLGIGINNKLSWAEHISNTVSKANKVLIYYYYLLLLVPTTRSIKISLNRFNVELQDLSVKIFDAKAMSLTC